MCQNTLHRCYDTQLCDFLSHVSLAKRTHVITPIHTFPCEPVQEVSRVVMYDFFFSPHFFLHFHMAIHNAYEQCVCLSWRANVTKYTAIPLRTTKNTQCMLTLHWWFQMNTKKIRQGKEVSTENIKLKHLSLQLLSMTCFPVI